MRTQGNDTVATVRSTMYAFSERCTPSFAPLSDQALFLLIPETPPPTNEIRQHVKSEQNIDRFSFIIMYGLGTVVSVAWKTRRNMHVQQLAHCTPSFSPFL